MRPDPSVLRLTLRAPNAWIGSGLTLLGAGQAAIGAMLRHTAPGGWTMLAVGAAIALLGLALLARALNAARRLRRLAREGEMVAAVVTEIRKSRMKVENKPQFRLVYAYQGRDGAAREGVSRLGPEDRFAGLKPGRGATVYVDPDDPTRSAWAGDLG